MLDDRGAWAWHDAFPAWCALRYSDSCKQKPRHERGGPVMPLGTSASDDQGHLIPIDVNYVAMGPAGGSATEPSDAYIRISVERA